MLKERLAQEDCNAGAIFDCLESEQKYWPDAKYAIELIADTVPTQNLQLYLLKFQKQATEAEGEETLEVCTNYRFARRHQAGAPPGKKKEEKAPEPDAADLRKKAKKTTGAAKPRKGGAKGAAAKEDEATANELTEAEKKLQQDQEKKRLEDEARALQKPKEYADEEVVAYEQYCTELEQFFAELTLRQQAGSGPIEGTEPADGEQQTKPAEGEEADAEAKGDEGAQDDGEKAKTEENQPQPGQPRRGKRILTPAFVEYDFKFLCESAKSAVPEPLWPDPDKEPLPPPIVHQIIRRPPTRPERKEITMFSIWTPLPEPPAAATGEDGAAVEEPEEGQKDPFPPMTKEKTRWVLGPKESAKLFIKFFSQSVGSFSQTLKFEIVGSPRAFDLNIVALCELPRLNEFYKNVFMTHKKTRPPQPPDSIVQKTFIVSENVFDFGPLLIKKDPEQRATDETLKKVNSSVLRITNDGEYPVDAAFTLQSTLPSEEGGPGEKSPFILEPESMQLAVRETKDLTVFAFPDQARLYKDQIVCLLKDNPNPTIFHIQALGAEPVIEVDQEVVEFDRLLLGKTLTKTLTLKNVCPIPAKWKLTGVDELAKDNLKVSISEGTLQRCQEQVIEITFSAVEEARVEPEIKLEVEDIEAHGIHQETKIIKIQAEAFKISPNVIVGKDESQILDFGAVRVGEPKENTITIKNEGKYPIKYNFTRKKKLTRDIFTVEPE